MKHPILDCTVPIEAGIEAHIEQLEEDLLHKREWLVAIHLSGTDKFTVEEIAECIVDIDLLKEHLGKLR